MLINRNLVFKEVKLSSVIRVEMSKENNVGVTFKRRSHMIGQNHQAFSNFLEGMWPKVQADWTERRGWRKCVPLPSHPLQGHMAEEIGHRLAVVSSPDGLGEDHGYVDDLKQTTWPSHDTGTTNTQGR